MRAALTANGIESMISLGTLAAPPHVVEHSGIQARFKG